jgi:hypothetical protein
VVVDASLSVSQPRSRRCGVWVDSRRHGSLVSQRRRLRCQTLTARDGKLRFDEQDDGGTKALLAGDSE